VRRALLILLLSFLPVLAGVEVDLVQDKGGSLDRRLAEKLLAIPDTLLRAGLDDRSSWQENGSTQLEQELHGQGYLAGKVQLSLEVLDSARNQATAHVVIVWGPLYRFAPVQLLIHGNGPYPDTSTLAIHASSPFNQEAITQTLQQLSEHYMGHGYLNVSCVPALDLDTTEHLVRTAFDIRPGRVVIYGAMAFTGLRLTRSDILRSLWNARPGDTVRPETVRSFTQKLYQAKLFSNVRLQPDVFPTDSTLSLIRVNVIERTPGSVDGLVSFDPIYGADLEGVIRHRNILGTLNELSLTGKLAQRDQLLQLGYGTPLLFGSDAKMDYDIALEQQSAALADTTASRLLSLSNKGTFTYPIRSWITSWVTLTTARQSWYYPGGDNRVDYAYSAVLGQDFTQKNDPVDPTKGWLVSGQVGNGGDIGRDTSYWWIAGQSKAWIPIWGPFHTAFALDGGMFLNSTTLDGAAIFWQGGSRSVRSYGFSTLRVETDNPDNPLCPRYVRGSAELRMNLPWDFQVVGFNDWTRLWNEGEPSHLFQATGAPWGYGVGLRYKISLLSLRLDYSPGRGPDRFTFDLSQAI
jgi:outer membrane protein assembly factor BamA